MMGSCCILLFAGGGSLMTPHEFERHAGQATAKNWKKTICYAGRPIGNILQGSLDPEEKKPFIFNASSQQVHGRITHRSTILL